MLEEVLSLSFSSVNIVEGFPGRETMLLTLPTKLKRAITKIGQMKKPAAGALKKTLEVIVLAKLYLKGGLHRRETKHRTLETAYCNQRAGCCKE
jgi:hypothetical protein